MESPIGAKVISFLNGKGGTGKTTTALCVAWCLARLGFRVAVVDTDPQQSALGWASDSCPFDVFAASEEKEIYAIRRTLAHYQYVIIDGAATITAISAACVMVSDVVIIPVSASPLDFAACAGVLAVIEARSALKPVIARFCITKRVTNASMNKTLTDSIKATGIEALRHGTKHRQSYVKSLIGGGSVFTGNDKQAQAEIELMTKEILELVEAVE
ncbi:TPA: AAA family ATPase [Escherichia coli]|nr:AAA family ATPase [Escherichia coli]